MVAFELSSKERNIMKTKCNDTGKDGDCSQKPLYDGIQEA